MNVTGSSKYNNFYCFKHCNIEILFFNQLYLLVLVFETINVFITRIF